MNKTVAYVVVGVLMALSIAGYVALVIAGHDTKDYVSTVLQLLGLAIVAGGLGAGLQKIEKQTNGTLSVLLARNQALELEVSQLREQYAAEVGHVPPVDMTGPVPTPRPAAP